MSFNELIKKTAQRQDGSSATAASSRTGQTRFGQSYSAQVGPQIEQESLTLSSSILL